MISTESPKKSNVKSVSDFRILIIKNVEPEVKPDEKQNLIYHSSSRSILIDITAHEGLRIRTFVAGHLTERSEKITKEEFIELLKSLCLNYLDFKIEVFLRSYRSISLPEEYIVHKNGGNPECFISSVVLEAGALTFYYNNNVKLISKRLSKDKCCYLIQWLLKELKT